MDRGEFMKLKYQRLSQEEKQKAKEFLKIKKV